MRDCTAGIGIAALVRLYCGWRILVGFLKRFERRLASGFTREIPRRRCATRRKQKAYQKNYADYRSVHVLFSSRPIRDSSRYADVTGGTGTSCVRQSGGA
jgi:hypothetical protein